MLLLPKVYPLKHNKNHKSEKLLQSHILKSPINDKETQKIALEPPLPFLSVKKLALFSIPKTHIKKNLSNEILPPISPIKKDEKLEKIPEKFERKKPKILSILFHPHEQKIKLEEENEEDSVLHVKSLSIEEFRAGIIGRNVLYDSPFGGKIMTLYADDTASGRPHEIVEKYIRSILPLYANTHSDNSYFPVSMHLIYKDAMKYMKEIFHAPENYEVLGIGTGSTGAIYRFQEILLQKYGSLMYKDHNNPPVVIITEYEHHSNILSWQKFGFKIHTIANSWCHQWDKALIDLHDRLIELIKNSCPLIVISTSACSNVTSQLTPLEKLSEVINDIRNTTLIPIVWGADLAALTPHRRVNMTALRLDAIYISPHKLTGGPGTCGVLIFNKEHYDVNNYPTHPAGGTVSVVYNYIMEDVMYVKDVLERESAGTPGILQMIRTKEAFALQDKIGLEYIEHRENELKLMIFKAIQLMIDQWKEMGSLHRVEILGTQNTMERSSVFSVVMFDDNGKRYHYHLMQRMLNDIFGIQLRSGCNCAGPFGINLLTEIFQWEEQKENIMKEVKNGNFTNKPGWVRFNVHYSFTDFDIKYIVFALQFVTENGSRILNEFYVEIDGDFKIRKKNRLQHKTTLTMMTASTVNKLEIKEVSEEERIEYLEKTMNSAKYFVKTHN